MKKVKQISGNNLATEEKLCFQLEASKKFFKETDRIQAEVGKWKG